ncbi:hypothetical protein UP10_38550 [Bradyrhizobium sp. LTSPM299]|nr:hypothetical protein UP10_38550 [Bradyrhizobium sp. LTSPM299]
MRRSFATLESFVSGGHDLDSTPLQCRLIVCCGKFDGGTFMKDVNTGALKSKKIQTATMKRRALKPKSMGATGKIKARSPQVRAIVVSPPQPPGM